MSWRSFAFATTTLALVAWAETDQGNCENNAVPSEGHQLLQKVFRNEGKLNQTEKLANAHLQEPVCTGVIAQGRCWYLSELDESCAATCAKNGFGFSYVVADPENPITPLLVGHEPAGKQEAWAALECYVPSEDRFHVANPNSAKHIVNDIGTWKYENCKLACPCGNSAGNGETSADKCGWKQVPACAPSFVYKGQSYTGCATVDSEHGRPWCQHHYQHAEGDLDDWSYCEYACAGDPVPPTTPPSAPTTPPSIGCDWKPADSCVAEFDYEGTHYIGCTDVDHENPWCSNTNPYRGSWNHCVYTCPNGPTPVPPQDDDTLCTWQLAPECSRAFQYKGIDYTDCITFDHPTPWCSLDRIHKGSWTKCTRTCNPVSTPTSVPIPPVVVEDPCTRHPEVENDNIGNTVTLDESGYKTTASADSPINMKRFICRVVGKVGCRVNDLPSLMAFVPYYSGLVSQQTYSRLEGELITLCHAGGKWVEPLPAAVPA